MAATAIRMSVVPFVGHFTILASKYRLEFSPNWWSRDSNILRVSGVDTSDGRHHVGPLVIEPACPRRATRILIYEFPTPDEAMEQRTIISHYFKTLYVFPVLLPAGNRTHRLTLCARLQRTKARPEILDGNILYRLIKEVLT
jgi:hypothetical protein